MFPLKAHWQERGGSEGDDITAHIMNLIEIRHLDELFTSIYQVFSAWIHLNVALTSRKKTTNEEKIRNKPNIEEENVK